jgi:hypothetical protein
MALVCDSPKHAGKFEKAHYHIQVFKIESDGTYDADQLFHSMDVCQLHYTELVAPDSPKKAATRQKPVKEATK